jgi:hypothetical protein
MTDRVDPGGSFHVGDACMSDTLMGDASISCRGADHGTRTHRNTRTRVNAVGYMMHPNCPEAQI